MLQLRCELLCTLGDESLRSGIHQHGVQNIFETIFCGLMETRLMWSIRHFAVLSRRKLLIASFFTSFHEINLELHNFPSAIIAN